MNIFIKKIIIFFTIYLFIHLSAILYFFIIKTEAKTVYDFLYKYQVEKIKTTSTVETVFIGDSSLGNSIDSNLFSKIAKTKSINIALTGMYGYAGSFNMLKKTIASHPELTNVVITQTLDMQMRKVSLQGYAYTMSDYSDFQELSLKHKLKTIYSFTKIRQFIFASLEILIKDKKINNDVLKNDYIKQGNPIKLDVDITPFNPVRINKKKNFFLKKIVELCKNKNLNLIYAYGPLNNKIVESSKKYIQTSNSNIVSTNITLMENVIPIENADLGDSNDHIRPEAKQKYTAIYAKILKPHLILSKQ